uniref:Glyceraldehyde-3-phosphate dehydrogenase n=1 Tax=Rhizophora mucronata TaxID=61149 RepID=A0A2P2JNC8_RHIMU
MAFSTCFRSTAAATATASFVEASPFSDLSPSLTSHSSFKVLGGGFNQNLKAAKSIFGASVQTGSSSLQTCSGRSLQPVKATATEIPPVVRSNNQKLCTQFFFVSVICCHLNIYIF